MERLELRFKDALRSLETLEAIMDEPFSIIVRDAAIQRFEYTFEAFWKFVKEYLRIRGKIIANSPKQCFRQLFTLGMITEDENVAFLEMTDERNMTSHTYKEEVANIIYGGLKRYCRLMKKTISMLVPKD